MDSIVTLTMNPALDITTDAEVVRPTDKIRCSGARYDAGGGGINVRKDRARTRARRFRPSSPPAAPVATSLPISSLRRVCRFVSNRYRRADAGKLHDQ